jgi:electron transfer flavoprotein beta subunit
MRIVVCLKEVVDSTAELAFGRLEDALFHKGLTYKVNPADWQALADSLAIKSQGQEIEVSVVSLGPQRVEGYLREALAMGADQAWRIRDAGLVNLSSLQKARILSGAVSLINADLVLAGVRSLDNASGQVGPAIAAILNLPCICQVTGFQIESDQKTVTVTRNVSRGIRERILCTLPALLTIEPNRKGLPYPAVEKLLASQEAAIKQLDLSDLGISPGELETDPIEIKGPVFPRPRVKKTPAPDSAMPAFYRILALLRGGIAKRRGRMLQGSQQALIDQLFDLLVKEKVLKTAPGRRENAK